MSESYRKILRYILKANFRFHKNPELPSVFQICTPDEQKILFEVLRSYELSIKVAAWLYLPQISTAHALLSLHSEHDAFREETSVQNLVDQLLKDWEGVLAKK